MRHTRRELEQLDETELDELRSLIDEVATWHAHLRAADLDLTVLRATWAQRQERDAKRAALAAAARRIADELRSLDTEDADELRWLGDWIRRWRAAGGTLAGAVAQLRVEDPPDSLRSWLGKLSRLPTPN